MSRMKIRIELFFNRRLNGEEVGELLKEIDELMSRKFREHYDGFGVHTEWMGSKDVEVMWKRWMLK